MTRPFGIVDHLSPFRIGSLSIRRHACSREGFSSTGRAAEPMIAFPFAFLRRLANRG
jgi:hypothetical protein